MLKAMIVERITSSQSAAPAFAGSGLVGLNCGGCLAAGTSGGCVTAAPHILKPAAGAAAAPKKRWSAHAQATYKGALGRLRPVDRET
jgi:hypothetical protein